MKVSRSPFSKAYGWKISYFHHLFAEGLDEFGVGLESLVGALPLEGIEGG